MGGGVMEDGRGGGHRGLITPEGFTSQDYARLQCPLVKLNAGILVSILSSDKELAIGRIKVGLAVVDLGNGGGQSPGQTHVERNFLGHSPIVLDEGPVHLPSAACPTTFESLIVNGQAEQTEKQIRFRITGPKTTGNPESVLETLRLYVHLIGADAHSGLDVMLSANHVQRVRDGEYVGAALKRGEATIAN